MLAFTYFHQCPKVKIIIFISIVTLKNVICTCTHKLWFYSTGLFQKAISHSGSAIKLFSLATKPRAQAKRLADKLNCNHTETGIEISLCLKALDASQIVRIHKEEMVSVIKISNFSFIQHITMLPSMYQVRCLVFTVILSCNFAESIGGSY